ncbi:MAG: hypothetical protein KF878_02540 [Planctomycetes bacterium]|nr:hypothetical protein [Planctomycetota bacterium]
MHDDETTRVPSLLAVGLGEVAGLVFVVGQCVVLGPVLVTRLNASILLGDYGISPDLNLWGAATMGALAHVVLAGLFGGLFAALHRSMVPRARLRLDVQAATGAVYGLALWFVNVQLVGRAGYEWFLELPQALMAALHALTFGLPLGLFFAFAARGRARRLAERRAPAAPRPATPTLSGRR